MQTMPRCAHCNVEIRDQSTMINQAGQTFCCNNRAIAMERSE